MAADNSARPDFLRTLGGGQVLVVRHYTTLSILLSSTVSFRLKPAMPPPEPIYEVFKFANDMREIQASQLYRPYYVLLNYLFPPEEGYIVFPQYKVQIQSRFSVDFRNIYPVKHKKHYDVLFFLQVKSSEDLSHISSRQEADLQMWEKFSLYYSELLKLGGFTEPALWGRKFAYTGFI